MYLSKKFSNVPIGYMFQNISQTKVYIKAAKNKALIANGKKYNIKKYNELHSFLKNGYGEYLPDAR
jgi:hypothetical protein